MKYFIKVDSNNDYSGHPIKESNLRQAFPSLDFSSGTPAGYLEFIRVPEPKLGPYEQFDESKGVATSEGFAHNGLEYKLVDGKYTDFWNIIPSSDEDKKIKQQNAKLDFEYGPNKDFKSWIWDEEKCLMVAPVPYPDVPEGSPNEYEWNESTLSWDKAIWGTPSPRLHE
tara:strand:+ start:6171 stop:6677 length:507 start_codon:yes stop_codon:yes gene_type:complete